VKTTLLTLPKTTGPSSKRTATISPGQRGREERPQGPRLLKWQRSAG
jgi:hypothetical protein